MLTSRVVEQTWRDQLKAPTNRVEEIRGNGEAGFEVLEDKSLMLKLVPLRHRKSWGRTTTAHIFRVIFIHLLIIHNLINRGFDSMKMKCTDWDSQMHASSGLRGGGSVTCASHKYYFMFVLSSLRMTMTHHFYHKI